MPITCPAPCGLSASGDGSPLIEFALIWKDATCNTNEISSFRLEICSLVKDG